jgi:hypothetical protein
VEARGFAKPVETCKRARDGLPLRTGLNSRTLGGAGCEAGRRKTIGAGNGETVKARQKKAPDLAAGALSRSEERAAQNTKE